MNLGTLHSYASVGSTMDIAREMALSGGGSPGSVVMAEFQTGGRGRQGRGWFAPPGANVCMTVIGEPVPADKAWQVALVAGVAAAQGVAEATGLNVAVRFPNDVYFQGAKMGGILIETVPGAKPGRVVPLVGIGVNVNVAADAFPDALRDRATSILCVAGREVPVGVVSGRILGRLMALWDDTDILPRWRALSDPDAVRTFQIDGRPERCRVTAIAADGAVSLETEAGERRTVHAAQVILGDD